MQGIRDKTKETKLHLRQRIASDIAMGATSPARERVHLPSALNCSFSGVKAHPPKSVCWLLTELESSQSLAEKGLKQDPFCLQSWAFILAGKKQLQEKLASIREQMSLSNVPYLNPPF